MMFSLDIIVVLSILDMFSNERYTYTKLDYFIHLEDLRKITLEFGKTKINAVFVTYFKFHYKKMAFFFLCSSCLHGQ